MSVAQRGIVTPEAVLLDFEIAGLASRALGFVIDMFGRLGVLGVLAAVAALIAQATGGGETLQAVLVTIASFVAFFGYSVACEAWFSGRSLGKAAVGTRVVTVEGGPVRFRHSAVRSALLVVDMIAPVGVLSILLTSRSQRLGDVFGGTIVLRERTGQRPSLPVTFPPPVGLETYAASLDVSAITEQQYEVLRGFLTRVFDLTPAARNHLSTRLANPVAVAMNHTPPPGLHPELFLASVAAAYQRRHAR